MTQLEIAETPPSGTEIDRIPDVVLRVLRDGKVIEVQVARSTSPPAMPRASDPETEEVQSALAELAHQVGAQSSSEVLDAGPEFPRRLQPRKLSDLLPDGAADQLAMWVELAFERGAKTDGFYRVADEDDIVRTFHASVLPGEADGVVRIRDVTVTNPALALEAAVEQGELSLRLSPRVNANGQPIMGRSMAYWHHPEVGDVPVDPSYRTPVVDDALVDWMVHSAVRYVASATNVGIPLGVSVDVTTTWIQRSDAPATLNGLLECYGAEPSMFELVLDYDAWMLDPESISVAWEELRQLGCKVAVAGVGRHSLDFSELEFLRPDRWILDPLWAQRCREDVGAASIEALLVLGKGLGIETIAAGVSKVEIKDRLEKLGCDAFEGDVFGPARDGYELLRQVRRRMRQRDL